MRIKEYNAYFNFLLIFPTFFRKFIPFLDKINNFKDETVLIKIIFLYEIESRSKISIISHNFAEINFSSYYFFFRLIFIFIYIWNYIWFFIYFYLYLEYIWFLFLFLMLAVFFCKFYLLSICKNSTSY